VKTFPMARECLVKVFVMRGDCAVIENVKNGSINAITVIITTSTTSRPPRAATTRATRANVTTKVMKVMVHAGVVRGFTETLVIWAV
jgi:hypothetical protein